MNHILMLFSFDGPEGPTFDSLTFPLWQAYGHDPTAVERRIHRLIAGAEVVEVRDFSGEPWPIRTSTIRLVLIWQGSEGPAIRNRIEVLR